MSTSVADELAGVAREQVVNDGEYHHCMICHKFSDKDANKVEYHLMKSHSKILALIYEEQDHD